MQIGPALIDGSSDDASGRRFRTEDVSSTSERAPVARCDVHLTLPASAGNVVLVRRVMGALAESLRLSLARVEDIKLAVTEACSNVVRHAYPGAAGTMDVIARTEAGRLTVEVSDQGDGFQPRAGTGGPGLGLPLMASIARDFEIEQDRVGGTRVKMSFPESE
jgi:serine/threonine-protein kinase RsbW